MLQLDPFVKHAEEYDAWYDKHTQAFESEVLAIKQQMLSLGQDIHGIEVGLGTGRFAHALGIREGIEPVSDMAKFAVKRGVEVMKGTAEKLPYRDLHFDFVLFVTICHLNDLRIALRESYRVLKKEGAIIIGFLDKERAIARSYIARREESHFYKHATFYSVDRLKNLLKEAGFKDLTFNQTLFGELDEIDTVEAPINGFGKGSFVVVKAKK